jgi:hypothetical protein
MPPRVNPQPLFDGAVKAGSQDDKAGDCDYRERFLFSDIPRCCLLGIDPDGGAGLATLLTFNTTMREIKGRGTSNRLLINRACYLRALNITKSALCGFTCHPRLQESTI